MHRHALRFSGGQRHAGERFEEPFGSFAIDARKPDKKLNNFIARNSASVGYIDIGNHRIAFDTNGQSVMIKIRVGKPEAKAEAKVEFVLQGHAKGFPVEAIAAFTNLPVEQVLEILKQHRLLV